MTTRKNRHKRQTDQPASKRKTWLISVALITLGAVVVTIVAALLSGNQQPYTPEVTGKPNAKVDTTRLDFGNVSFETPVEAVFRVQNTGDQTLSILEEPRVELLQGC